jgi:superfamily II DNA/RNA helicase/HKD family nuclease
MGSIIDNRKKTMLEELKKALQNAESIDISSAYFYFSGFNELADVLKNKKVRIIVGKALNPDKIVELSNDIKKDPDTSLDDYNVQGLSKKSNTEQMNIYIQSFIAMFNKSSLSEEFDKSDSQKAFKIFIEKLFDGTLEIKLCSWKHHGKFYVITNNPNQQLFQMSKGTVFMGSSNFTYNGLIGQGEMNERFETDKKYDEYTDIFESLWKDSKTVDIHIKESNTKFIEELKQKLWLFSKPTPYQIYIRILHELYSAYQANEIPTPSEMSDNRYENYIYQLDAIKMGIECIKDNNGVIIADVVGLGKSIIASAIARNLDMTKHIIIAPPHLIEQWTEYQRDFGLRGCIVESGGQIEKLHQNYASDPSPILYIIDEAHRYRNELTDSYKLLHQLTRSNAQNKVILLTATPYNNRPMDLYALIKLFQTPSYSTIKTVDNLGYRFGALITEYRKLERQGKKEGLDAVKDELNDLSKKLRNLIEPVVIRRSRIDLQEIKEYDNDLKRQNITFPEVVGPELIEYDLGDIHDIYKETLTKLSDEFDAARYKPTADLFDQPSFMEKYGELFDVTDIVTIHKNLAKLIKRQMVMRFESSKSAFNISLENIIKSHETVIKWWEHKEGYVPIWKRGYLSDPDAYEIDEILEEINRINDDDYDLNRLKNKVLVFPKNLFKDDYIEKVRKDLSLLKAIKDEWFPLQEVGFDPKLDKVKSEITKLLKDDKNRKIVIFSIFSATVEYLKTELPKTNLRVFSYTGGSSRADRAVVRENFDASMSINNQHDDYDILIATDTLSEGINLNRAGVIINYDIPYNPTRVVQRIGRINRINKKMFDKIFIYNFFPTDIGEENTSIKGISTLKMLLINNIVGSDTRTLTPDETLQSYFKKQYDEADTSSNDRSWDNEYINTYNSVKHTDIIEKVKQIPERVRIVRKNQNENIAISFAKRGNNSLFAIARPHDTNAEIKSAEEVMPYFKATVDEQSFDLDDELDKKFAILRDEINKPTPKNKIEKRKSEAIANLEKLLLCCPAEKNYLTDLLEIIRDYDDLCDGELKDIASLSIKENNVEKMSKIIDELKEIAPLHYINQIKEKVEQLETQTEIIMFTEDLRYDD